MDVKITTLDGGEAGTLSLSDAIFGLEPRQDLLARMVRWQLAKRRAGTHDVKNRAEVARTGAKMYKQKGTGRARHSSARAPQFRGGGRAFGPTPRDHAHGLPKKVRALALRHALSAKAVAGELIVIDDLVATEAKTAALKARMMGMGLLSGALLVGGTEIDENFRRASQNLAHVDVLPVQGLNVYDILRRGKLVLSRAAVEAIEQRFAEESV